MFTSRRLPVLALLGGFLALAVVSAPGQDEQVSQPDLRIAATLSTKPLLTAVARVMKEQKGLDIVISACFTSLDALDALAQGKVEMAFLTKPLTGEDRAQYPDVDLVAVPVGMEVIALGVSGDLWDAGLHTISQKDMRAIYEQKITNWKDAGGPDEKITFFNFEQGGGVWEIFAEWLYGDNRKAPLPKVESVANSQDARDTLEFTPGSISPIGASFVDGVRCHALGIILEDGIAIAWPTADQIAAKTYPIVRPIVAVTIGRPALANRAVTDYLTSPAGQALVKSTGAMGCDAVPKPPPEPQYFQN